MGWACRPEQAGQGKKEEWQVTLAEQGGWAQSWLQGSGSTPSLALLVRKFLLLCPSPHPSRSTQGPWVPPETRGPDAQLNAAGVWRKDKDKPSLRTRQGRAGQGSAQEKGGEGEDRIPRSWPPAEAWKVEKLGTPAFFGGPVGATAQPCVAVWTHHVTRTLCFVMMLG